MRPFIHWPFALRASVIDSAPFCQCHFPTLKTFKVILCHQGPMVGRGRGNYWKKLWWQQCQTPSNTIHQRQNVFCVCGLTCKPKAVVVETVHFKGEVLCQCYLWNALFVPWPNPFGSITYLPSNLKPEPWRCTHLMLQNLSTDLNSKSFPLLKSFLKKLRQWSVPTSTCMSVHPGEISKLNQAG